MMISKFFPPLSFARLLVATACLFPLSSVSAATVTDLKQNMGKNHFWMTMRSLPENAPEAVNGNLSKPANKCLLAYIEKPHFRKKITLAFILSAEKNRLLVQSGSAEWHLKPHEKGDLNLKAGHWIHHFKMAASKPDEITARMPEEEMRSLLNTLSRNVEGTLEYSSGKIVLLPLKNIATEINDFKRCARDNHLADLGDFVPEMPKKRFFKSKSQTPKQANHPF